MEKDNSIQYKKIKKKSAVADNVEINLHDVDNDIENNTNLLDIFVFAVMAISLSPAILACFNVFIIPECIFDFVFVGGSIKETLARDQVGTLLISGTSLCLILFLAQHDILKLQKEHLFVKVWYCCLIVLFIISVYLFFIFK